MREVPRARCQRLEGGLQVQAGPLGHEQSLGGRGVVDRHQQVGDELEFRPVAELAQIEAGTGEGGQDRPRPVKRSPVTAGIDGDVLRADLRSLEQEFVVAFECFERSEQRIGHRWNLGEFFRRKFVEVLVERVARIDSILDAVQTGEQQWPQNTGTELRPGLECDTRRVSPSGLAE